MTNLEKYKLYASTLLRYYFTQKPRLTWRIILSLVVFIWLAVIVRMIMTDPIFSEARTGLDRLGKDGLGLWVLFVKPIFVYVAGLIIINNMDKP